MTEKPQYTGKMLDELFAKVDDALEARSDSARTGENGRQLCSPEHPMPKDALGRWEHTNVKEVGECMDAALTISVKIAAINGARSCHNKP